MKAAPIIVNWHAENAPIYSADFQPHGRGRLATAGGDNNVRLWRIDVEGEDRKVEYLCTMVRHTQAVNVVRWAPRGGFDRWHCDVLASAGDDGNVIIWVLDSQNPKTNFGDDGIEDKESWRTRHMCRSTGAEIYDLAWSPDGLYLITGSMDNVARIYNSQTGQLIRQIAEHQHYVQGVAWDPLNEYIATQSSDRSVHIYTLRTKDGNYVLDNRDEIPKRIGHNMKMDLPGRRISSSSPAPPDMGCRSQMSSESFNLGAASPVPSCPGTPTSLALPMNPPSTISHSRRSSFGAASPAMSMRRSVSPAPSLPLPAVMPMEASPRPYSGLGMRNANIYANDTLKSFFRRLTFTPDGSLLFTPAGQYQTQHKGPEEVAKAMYEVINTVYIYTRGGINKPPIAHLPGHKKPSVVVKCSPIFFNTRRHSPATKHITIDTSSPDSMPALPEPAIVQKSPAPSVMDPPPPVAQTSDPSGPTSSPKPKPLEVETNASTPGPTMAFSLPYRMIYAVATEDSVLMYDTQQQTPLCVVSNLHCATFTDLTWSNDGQILLMTSSDGFCSTLTFAPGELGQAYVGEVPTAKHPLVGTTAVSSSQNTPMATPTSIAPPSPFPVVGHHHRTSSNLSVAASPPPASSNSNIRPSSPTRSNSTSSIATQSSFAQPPGSVISNPTLVGGSLPSIAAGNLSFVPGMPMTTPPQTPRSTTSSVSGAKRDHSESEREDLGGERKKRRIAPTLIGEDGTPASGSVPSSSVAEPTTSALSSGPVPPPPTPADDPAPGPLP
ncbi:WD40-repeat-containing domain protein [Amylocarpus encephaloides]|uniref:WD40-repeat-containing domain protein n=1 Tax=Amylocarpus encephaloides TaxID=45428 RepID=A0A9P7YHD8_9HELO|nr:WD40-repeat-containing domain protein [Amylocarpus encephaloides]